jgi:hypothetical protein
VCNSSFTRPSGLERHKKTGKYCLLLQNTSIDIQTSTLVDNQPDSQISTPTDIQTDNQISTLTSTLVDNQSDSQISTPTDNQSDSQISTLIHTQIDNTYSRLSLDKKTDKFSATLHKFGLHPYEQYLHSVKRSSPSYLFVLYSSGLLDENGHLTLTISKQFNF